MHFTAKIRGEDPLEQQTAEAIMLGRNNGRSARLAPADPQPLTSHVDHPLDIDFSTLTESAPCFAALVASSCAAMPSVSACLGGSIAGGPARVTFVLLSS